MSRSAYGHLQPGLAVAAGERPLPCWRLILLDVRPGTAPAEARDAVGRMLCMLDELSGGRVRDLAGQPREHEQASADHFAGLSTLIAFGRRFFDVELHEPPLTGLARPAFLSYLPRHTPLAGLAWSTAGDETRSGESDIALQLLAPREAAVDCAAVEIWKLVEDETLPFSIRASFAGFGRPDGRGWLDFHDGVSNLPAEQRTPRSRRDPTLRG